MPDRLSTLRVVAMVALVAVLLRPGEATAPKVVRAPAAEAAEQPADERASPRERIERLICRHFAISCTSTDRSALEAALACTSGGCPASISIATVPDPLDSHLSYMFDEQVDALTRAATTRGYTLESWTFPWPKPATKKPPADLGEIESPKPDSLARRSAPGAMLFRRDGDSAGLLVVLLVGEAPTFGVHPSALHEAFELIAELTPASSSSLDVAFVGPTYSGSAPGLREALTRWFSPAESLCKESTPWHIRFITGSATARDVGRLGENPVTRCVSTEFRRTVHTDDQLAEAFFAYLALRGDGPEQCAELSERATAYGGERAKNQCALRLTFPLHLAQLRDATEKSHSGEQVRARLESPLGRNALDFEMRADGAAVDIPWPYSPSLSANVIELELKETLAALRQRRTEYVGLKATDARDKLFLATLLRTVAPSAHVFTFESDVLFSHPRFSQDLLGALVVSSYPLTAKLPGGLQLWRNIAGKGGDSDATPTTFPNGATEGTYQAALAAFPPPAGVSPCAHDLLCWWELGNKTAPPIWVSAIGRDSAWPLWVHDSEPSSIAISRKHWRRIAKQVEPSFFYRLVLVLGSLFGMTQGALYLTGRGLLGKSLEERVRGARLDASVIRWLLLPGIFSTVAPEPTVLRTAYLGLLLGLTAVPTWAALLPVFSPALTPKPSGRVAEIVAVFCTVAVLAPATACALASAARPQLTLAKLRLTASAGLVLGAVVICGSLATAATTDAGAGRLNWLLFSLRVTHPESGLTPLTPVVLLGTGLLAMVVMLARRRQLSVGVRSIAPVLENRDSAFNARLMPFVNAIGEEVRPLGQLRRLRPFSAAVFAVLAIVPAILLADQVWLPLDTIPWTGAFVASAITLNAAVVYSGLGYLSIWSTLRKLLRALSTSPLRDAFGRIPLRMSRSIGLEPTAAAASVSDLQYSVRQRALLSQLEGLLQKASPEFAVLWADHQSRRRLIEATLRSELESLAETAGRTMAGLTLTQGALSAESAIVVTPMLSEWWATDYVARGNSPAPTDLSSELKSLPGGRPYDAVTLIDNGFEPRDELFWFRLAEEYVAAQFVALVSHVFVQLRSLLRCTISGLILLLLAVSTYPLEPQVPVLNYATVLICGAVVAAFISFTQASRNELLSLIENTAPNEVSWNANLLGQIATYVAIPLLAAVTSQVPALARLAGTIFAAFTTR